MAVVSALESFVGRLSKDEPDKGKSGRSVNVVRGQLFESNHPVVLAFPTMFGELESVHRVEQATAAPGEKRGAR